MRSDVEVCGERCRACAALRRAAVQLAGEQGIDAVTTAAVADRAQVLAPLVVRHMGDSPARIVSAAYVESATDLQDRFAASLRVGVTWEDGLRRAVAGLLDTLARDPRRARLCFVEVLDAPPEIAAVRARLRDRSIRMLADRHRALGGDPDVPRLHFEFIEEAIGNAIARALRSRGPADVRGCLAPIMASIDSVPLTAAV